MSLEMKQNDSYIEGHTDCKDRNKEKTACFDPDLMCSLIIEGTHSTLKLGNLLLVTE